ncbi:uncharacterized protein LOC129005839 isoform X1 [Macrosteles quadrilineatus]|nr:uncharacterized protein LOC129005839 isoform X1 [Macrosteles quadrilineatus]
MRIGGLIRKALQKLPADSTKWPELLAETNHSPYIHLTIIIHLNFVLLRDCGDSMIKSSHLPALCKYILSKNSLPSPPELKAIAFVFAVLHLSHAQSVGNSRREIAQATQRIIQWLKCTEMSDVFTHHPALLYWIFNINDKPLQMSVIALWMRDKSPASQKELEDLVLKVDEAALLLVDILSCCSRKMLNEVMSPIKTILDRNSDQKIIISKHIWSKLPSIISRLTSPEITSKRLMNVSVVIYIACRTVPRIPDTRLMLRLSQQLVQAFQRFCGSTWEHTEINTQNLDTQLLLAQMLKLAHVIAFKMIHISEYRESGLKIFLEEDSVLRALLACMKSDCKIVTHPALKLLAYLLHSQNVYNIQIRSNGYVIGADFLQVLVEKCNIDTTFYAADLFNSLQVENTKMLISLSSNMRISVIHSLYHAFLKISRRPGEATGLCWRCGSLLLKYCRLYDQDVVIGLLYHPEYKKGLELAFKKGGIRDNYFAEYALEYFKAGRKYLSYYNDDLACTQNPVSTNLIRVAQQLLTRDWPSGSHQSSLLQEICSMDRKIPSNVINALKLKRSRLYSRVLSENSDTD